jgi:hypothetical protein
MKIIYGLLLILHVFVGTGAMAGGYAAISNPQAPLGVSLEILKNSPFSSFLIPGILLFMVIGVGNIIGALTILFKAKYQGYFSGVVSCGLVIWIIVQCIMLRTIHALHIIFFTLGAIQGFLSAVIIFNQKLFPANHIITYYKGTKKDI